MTQGVHEALGQIVPGPRVPYRPTAPVAVRIEYVGGVPTVHVTGRVERATIVEVSGTVRGLLAAGVSELAVDLSASWDAAGLLPVLARTRTDLAEHGGTLRLLGVMVPEFLAALRAAPLDEVFLIYDAVRAADPPTRLPAHRCAHRGGPRRAGAAPRRLVTTHDQHPRSPGRHHRRVRGYRS